MNRNALRQHIFGMVAQCRTVVSTKRFASSAILLACLSIGLILMWRSGASTNNNTHGPGNSAHAGELPPAQRKIIGVIEVEKEPIPDYQKGKGYKRFQDIANGCFDLKSAFISGSKLTIVLAAKNQWIKTDHTFFPDPLRFGDTKNSRHRLLRRMGI